MPVSVAVPFSVSPVRTVTRPAAPIERLASRRTVSRLPVVPLADSVPDPTTTAFCTPPPWKLKRPGPARMEKVSPALAINPPSAMVRPAVSGWIVPSSRKVPLGPPRVPLPPRTVRPLPRVTRPPPTGRTKLVAGKSLPEAKAIVPVPSTTWPPSNSRRAGLTVLVPVSVAVPFSVRPFCTVTVVAAAIVIPPLACTTRAGDTPPLRLKLAPVTARSENSTSDRTVAGMLNVTVPVAEMRTSSVGNGTRAGSQFDATCQLPPPGATHSIVAGTVVSVTVNVPAAVPLGVVMVTERGPIGALAAITKRTLRVVGLPVPRSVTVTPLPSIPTLETAARFCPCICAVTTVPCRPELGTIAVTIGGPPLTVNVLTTSAGSAFPATSRTPPARRRTVTTAFAGNGTLGVKVKPVLPAIAIVPLTVPAAVTVTFPVFAELARIPSSNTTVIGAVGRTPSAPPGGVIEVTAGGVASCSIWSGAPVRSSVTAGDGFPAASVACTERSFVASVTSGTDTAKRPEAPAVVDAGALPPSTRTVLPASAVPVTAIWRAFVRTGSGSTTGGAGGVPSGGAVVKENTRTPTAGVASARPHASASAFVRRTWIAVSVGSGALARKRSVRVPSSNVVTPAMGLPPTTSPLATTPPCTTWKLSPVSVPGSMAPLNSTTIA